MIIGVGLDIVDIPKMVEQAFGNPLGGFKENNFTKQEIATSESHNPQDPSQPLCARWAAKEAFLKALGMTNLGGERLLRQPKNREIEVVSDQDNRPSLVLHGEVRKTAERQGVKRISVSLTHDGDYAAAVVILEDTSG